MSEHINNGVVAFSLVGIQLRESCDGAIENVTLAEIAGIVVKVAISCGACATSIGVVVEGAGRGVIDDPIIAIMSGD